VTRPRIHQFALLLLVLLGAARGARAAGDILLILDDMGHGYDRGRLEACLGLPVEVAFSIIPGTARASWTARRCAEQGRDVLAHLPWQPLRARDSAERSLVPVDAGAARIRQVVERARRELPGMVAANNHQGSRACLDPGFLERFAAVWRDTGLPFVDSRTVAGSRVPEVLGSAGVAVFENRLFLDHVDEPDAIRAQLRELELLARGRDVTIAIAHPRPATLALLGEWCAHLPEGLRLLPASRALAPAVEPAPTPEAPGPWLAQRAGGWPLAAPHTAVPAAQLEVED
jgi:polysaccharide deacetylase 2 family uncharacterized protein YibQ